MIGYETYTSPREGERVLKTFESKNMWITIYGLLARNHKCRSIQGIWLTNQRVLTTTKSGFLLPGFLVDLDYNQIKRATTEAPSSLKLGLLFNLIGLFLGILLFSRYILDEIKINQGRSIEYILTMPFNAFFLVLPLVGFICLFLSWTKFSLQTFKLKGIRVIFKQRINIQGLNGEYLEFIGNQTAVQELCEDINKLKK